MFLTYYPAPPLAPAAYPYYRNVAYDEYPPNTSVPSGNPFGGQVAANLPHMAPQIPQMPAPLAPMAPPALHIPAAPMPAHPPVSGGINLVLDYDIATMAQFMLWCGFGMLKQTSSALAEFKSLLTSVLYATRLSRSTIVVALEYINQRFCSHPHTEMLESDIFMKMVVAMVLANKFNDDNTFTNRSWCGATGLLIASLNQEERSWLEEMNWELSVVLFEHNIRTLEECWSTWLEKYTEPVSPPASPLSPYHHNGYSPAPYPYNSYYDDWSCRNTQWTYPMYGYNPHAVGYTNPYYGSTAY